MNDTPTRADAPDTVEKGESLWVGAWHRLRKNKMALAGGVFILLLAGLSFVGPFFLEGDYYTNTLSIYCRSPLTRNSSSTSRERRTQRQAKRN